MTRTPCESIPAGKPGCRSRTQRKAGITAGGLTRSQGLRWVVAAFGQAGQLLPGFRCVDYNALPQFAVAHTSVKRNACEMLQSCATCLSSGCDECQRLNLIGCCRPLCCLRASIYAVDAPRFVDRSRLLKTARAALPALALFAQARSPRGQPPRRRRPELHTSLG